MIRERLEQQQQCEGMQWERTKKRSLHCVIENWKEMVPNTLEWHFSGSLYLSLALFKPFSIKFYCKSILITFNWFLHFDMNVWLTEESNREKKKYIKYDIITVYGERRRIERVAKKGLNALRTINARTEQQKREKQQHSHTIFDRYYEMKPDIHRIRFHEKIFRRIFGHFSFSPIWRIEPLLLL